MDFTDLLLCVIEKVMLVALIGIFIVLAIMLFIYSPLLCIATLALIVVLVVLDMVRSRRR